MLLVNHNHHHFATKKSYNPSHGPRVTEEKGSNSAPILVFAYIFYPCDVILISNPGQIVTRGLYDSGNNANSGRSHGLLVVTEDSGSQNLKIKQDANN